MWKWILDHPQRVTSFLLVVFSSVQTSLAAFQANLSPMAASIITGVFGLVMTALAWLNKNTTDKPETPK